MYSLTKLKPENMAICHRDVVNRLKMWGDFEMGDLIYAFFCRILHGNHHSLFHFRMVNTIFEYETPKNITLGPSYVAPQPP